MNSCKTKPIVGWILRSNSQPWTAPLFRQRYLFKGRWYSAITADARITQYPSAWCLSLWDRTNKLGQHSKPSHKSDQNRLKRPDHCDLHSKIRRPSRPVVVTWVKKQILATLKIAAPKCRDLMPPKCKSELPRTMQRHAPAYAINTALSKALKPLLVAKATKNKPTENPGSRDGNVNGLKILLKGFFQKAYLWVDHRQTLNPWKTKPNTT